MPDELLKLLAIVVVALVTGAGGWSFLSRWFDRKAESEESENKRLDARVTYLEEHGRACEREVAALKRQLAEFEHTHQSHIARWIKDESKRIIWHNPKAQLLIFAPLGIARRDVAGRTFAELLEPQAAQEIDRIDRFALAHPGDTVSVILQLHPKLEAMVIVKVAGPGRDGEVIYEGWAFKPNSASDVAERGAERRAEQLGASILRLAGPDPSDD